MNAAVQVHATVMDYRMDTKFLDKHGVDMDIITKKSVKRRIDLNMGTEFLKKKTWHRQGYGNGVKPASTELWVGYAVVILM